IPQSHLSVGERTRQVGIVAQAIARLLVALDVVVATLAAPLLEAVGHILEFRAAVGLDDGGEATASLVVHDGNIGNELATRELRTVPLCAAVERVGEASLLDLVGEVGGMSRPKDAIEPVWERPFSASVLADEDLA